MVYVRPVITYAIETSTETATTKRLLRSTEIRQNPKNPAHQDLQKDDLSAGHCGPKILSETNNFKIKQSNVLNEDEVF